VNTELNNRQRRNTVMTIKEAQEALRDGLEAMQATGYNNISDQASDFVALLQNAATNIEQGSDERKASLGEYDDVGEWCRQASDESALDGRHSAECIVCCAGGWPEEAAACS